MTPSGSLPPRSANVAVAAWAEGLDVTPVDLVAADGAPSSGLLYQKSGYTGTVGVHLMHPRTDQTRNYNIAALAHAGFSVLARNGRSVNNDVDTLHEDLLLDVAAGVEHLRNRGCERVVLLGNSGGGPLAAYYQWQAKTPGAERIPKDQTVAAFALSEAWLPAADGLLLIGSHLGQGRTLGRLLDASVVDETDPLSLDPSLDIYDPRNGFRLPVVETRYTPEFVARVRDAQARRVERIDQRAHALIAGNDQDRRSAAHMRAAEPPASGLRLWAERRSASRGYMTVYRTLADPALLDLSIDPDDRVAGGFESHPRPDIQNYRQVGFAHLLSARAWLSTWSANASHANLERALSGVTVPTLLVHYAGDHFTPMSSILALKKVVSSTDFDMHVVRRTDHYGRAINDDGSLGARASEGTQLAVRWVLERFAT